MEVFDHRQPFETAVIAAVAAGGAIGASARWFVGWLIEATAGASAPGAWPWPTLLVNLVGCALIGVAARSVERDSRSWAFVVTGVLGGFTTFSAFAVELNDMAEADRLPLAIGYGGVTLAAGVAATVLADAGRGRR